MANGPTNPAAHQQIAALKTAASHASPDLLRLQALSTPQLPLKRELAFHAPTTTSVNQVIAAIS